MSLVYGCDHTRPRVGPYRLIRRLGRGSQGEVWEAVRLDQPVEVVPPSRSSSPRAGTTPGSSRFRHEAERGAGLAGRGILPIYEFGQAGEVAFFAMPLVEGSTLSRVLDQRRRHRAGQTPCRWHGGWP